MASFTADEIDFVRSRGNEVSYLSFFTFLSLLFFPENIAILLSFLFF